jgi:hypothetical protein
MRIALEAQARSIFRTISIGQLFVHRHLSLSPES